MELRKVLIVALLMMTAVTFGCAGAAGYPPSGTPNRFGCDGDVPSPYPPYCHPRP